MARFRITAGDKVYEIEGPDDLTEEEIRTYAEQELAKAEPGQAHQRPIYGGNVQEDQPDSSATGSFLRGGVRGGTFNWGDELAAGANAVIPGLAGLDNLTGAAADQQSGWSNEGGFWDAFQHNLDAATAQEEADRAQHSTATTLGEVTGALSTAPLVGSAVGARLPQAVRAFGVARPVTTATGIGIGTGAASGAGVQGNRAQNAALGAITGGAVGTTVAGVSELAPAIKHYAQVFMGRNADETAIGQIIKALQRDGFDVTSPAGVLKLRNELRQFTGKPVSIADIGTATRARTGVALRTPNPQQDTSIDQVLERQRGQSGRIINDIHANVAPRSDVAQIDQDLVDQRAQAAGPLRDAALYEQRMIPGPNERPQITVNPGNNEPKAGVMRTLGYDMEDTFSQQAPQAQNQIGRVARVVDDPILQNLVRTPLGQTAMERALAQSRGMYAVRAAQGLPTEETPYIADGSNLDVRTLDAVKKYLDQEVGRLYRNGAEELGSFKKSDLYALQELRNGIRDRMREVVPGYGDYLDAYSGPSGMRDALDEGTRFLGQHPDTITAGQAGRTGGEQELYRVGTARSLIDKVNKTSDNGIAANSILSNDYARQQLDATGIDAARAGQLNHSLDQERQLSKLTGEVRGSDIAARQAAAADADSMSGLSLPMNLTNPIYYAGGIARKALRNLSTSRNEKVNAALLPRILSTDPGTVDATITELERQGNTALARQLKRRARERRISMIGGDIIGSPVSIQPEDDYGR